MVVWPMDKWGIDAGLEFVVELPANHLEALFKIKKCCVWCHDAYLACTNGFGAAEPPIHKLPPLQQSSIRCQQITPLQLLLGLPFYLILYMPRVLLVSQWISNLYFMLTAFNKSKTILFVFGDCSFDWLTFSLHYCSTFTISATNCQIII